MRINLTINILNIIFITNLILYSSCQNPSINNLPSKPIQILNELDGETFYTFLGESFELNLNDYYSGYNLSYPNLIDKVNFNANVLFNTSNQIMISKLNTTQNNSPSSILLLDIYGNLIIYTLNINNDVLYLALAMNISLYNSTESIIQCYDLYLLDTNFIIIDCTDLSNNQSKFYTVNTTNLDSNITTNEVLNNVTYNQNNPRWIVESSFYQISQGVEFLIFQPDITYGNNWRIDFYQPNIGCDVEFCSTIVQSLTNDTLSDITGRPDFMVAQLITLKDNLLLISTIGNILFLDSTLNPTFSNLWLPGINMFTVLQMINYTYSDNEEEEETLIQSKTELNFILIPTSTGVYEVTYSPSSKNSPTGSLWGPLNYKILYGNQIVQLIQSQDYIAFVSIDTEAAIYLHIYERGQTDYNKIFYVSNQTANIFSSTIMNMIPAINTILIFDSNGLQTIKINQPIIFLPGQTTIQTFTYDITVLSYDNNPNKASITVQTVSPNDSTVKLLNTQGFSEVSIYYPLQKYLNIEAPFLGPALSFSVQGNSNCVIFDTRPYMFTIISGISQPYKFVSFQYAPEIGSYKLFLQNEDYTNLTEYICYQSGFGYAIQCLDSLTNMSNLTADQIISTNPNFDIYSIASTQTLYTITEKDNPADVIMNISCKGGIYVSNDNLLEQYLYCCTNTGIYLYEYPFTQKKFFVKLGFSPQKILTHPLFPLILFTCDNQSIYVIFSHNYDSKVEIISQIDYPGLSMLGKSIDWLVTNSKLIIFDNKDPTNPVLVEYDISNLAQVQFIRNYPLYGYQPIIGDTSFQYSLGTDLVYLQAISPDGIPSIMVYDPSEPIGSVLRKIITIGGQSNTNLTMSITTGRSFPSFNTDYLVVYNQSDLIFYEVSPSVFGVFNNNPSSFTDLYESVNIGVTATSGLGSSTGHFSFQMISINTQRKITYTSSNEDSNTESESENFDYEGQIDLTIDDSATSYEINSYNTFFGPIFDIELANNNTSNEIILQKRVSLNINSTNSSNIMTFQDFNDMQLVNNKIYTQSMDRINIYNITITESGDANFAQISTLRINNTNGYISNCTDIYISENESLSVSLCQYSWENSFLYFMNLSNPSQYCTIDQQLLFPSNPHLTYKIVNNSIFMGLDQAQSSIWYIEIINFDQCIFSPTFYVNTSSAGFMLTSYDAIVINTYLGYFLTIFGTDSQNGLDAIFINLQSLQVYFSSYIDMENLFEDDFYVSVKNLVYFYGIEILSYNDLTYNVFVSSVNWNSYILSIQMDNFTLSKVNIQRGFIGYQPYLYSGLYSITSNYLILAASMRSFYPTLSTASYLFIYDINGSPIAGLNSSYYMYDAVSRIQISDTYIFGSNNNYWFEAIDTSNIKSLIITSQFASTAIYDIFNNYSILGIPKTPTQNAFQIIASNDMFNMTLNASFVYPRSSTGHIAQAILFFVIFLSLALIFGFLVFIAWRVYKKRRSVRMSAETKLDEEKSGELSKTSYRAIDE